MRKVVIVFVVAALLGFIATALAQAPAKPVAPVAEVKALPTLSEVQKLQIQNVLLRIELAQRTMQQAQTDFDKARTEAQTLISGLQVPGYDLDIAGMKYTAKPPEAPKPEPVKK